MDRITIEQVKNGYIVYEAAEEGFVRNEPHVFETFGGLCEHLRAAFGVDGVPGAADRPGNGGQAG